MTGFANASRLPSQAYFMLVNLDFKAEHTN
jgi:hypothetical protein